jgi:hypothetical protein
MRLVFPIAGFRGIVEFAKKRGVLRPQQCGDFAESPDIEFAFYTLAVSVWLAQNAPECLSQATVSVARAQNCEPPN